MAVVLVGLAGLYILSMPIVGGELISSLEARQPAAADVPEPGAIIILGADGERTPDPLVKAEPGPLSLQRLVGRRRRSCAKKKLPVLIAGGKVGEDEPTVSDLMAGSVYQTHRPAGEWRETMSENTCENAQFIQRPRFLAVQPAFRRRWS